MAFCERLSLHALMTPRVFACRCCSTHMYASHHSRAATRRCATATWRTCREGSCSGLPSPWSRRRRPTCTCWTSPAPTWMCGSGSRRRGWVGVGVGVEVGTWARVGVRVRVSCLDVRQRLKGARVGWGGGGVRTWVRVGVRVRVRVSCMDVQQRLRVAWVGGAALVVVQGRVPCAGSLRLLRCRRGGY